MLHNIQYYSIFVTINHKCKECLTHLCNFSNMKKDKFLSCRSDDDEVAAFRLLAAKLTVQRPGRQTTLSDVLRRCIFYGLPAVEREAEGLVVPDATAMTQYEQGLALAKRAAELGFRQMEQEVDFLIRKSA